MKKAFEKRIMKEGIVDTRKYRYYLHDTIGYVSIERIEISKLNTTAALKAWDVVKVLN